MGKSPLHAKNIALVLDRKTGYVSPQFHVQFDTNFMVAKDFSNGSEWQLKTGLFLPEPTKVLQNQRENTTSKSAPETKTGTSKDLPGKEPAKPLDNTTTKVMPTKTVTFQLGLESSNEGDNVNKVRPKKGGKHSSVTTAHGPCRKITVK